MTVLCFSYTIRHKFLIGKKASNEIFSHLAWPWPPFHIGFLHLCNKLLPPEINNFYEREVMVRPTANTLNSFALTLVVDGPEAL